MVVNQIQFWLDLMMQLPTVLIFFQCHWVVMSKLLRCTTWNLTEAYGSYSKVHNRMMQGFDIRWSWSYDGTKPGSFSFGAMMPSIISATTISKPDKLKKGEQQQTFCFPCWRRTDD